MFVNRNGKVRVSETYAIPLGGGRIDGADYRMIMALTNPEVVGYGAEEYVDFLMETLIPEVDMLTVPKTSSLVTKHKNSTHNNENDFYKSMKEINGKDAYLEDLIKNIEFLRRMDHDDFYEDSYVLADNMKGIIKKHKSIPMISKLTMDFTPRMVDDGFGFGYVRNPIELKATFYATAKKRTMEGRRRKEELMSVVDVSPNVIETDLEECNRMLYTIAPIYYYASNLTEKSNSNKFTQKAVENEKEGSEKV